MMKVCVRLSVVSALLAGGFLPAGCNPKKAIQLRYERAASIEIPAGIKRVGIAEFGGQTAEDKKWGAIASDRLTAALAERNRKYNRYELVDRQRLKAILDEQDLQAAISDSATAGQAGKLAHVQAMVYGTVRATVKETSGTKNVVDLRRGMKSVPYTHRYCVAAVNFTMDDVGTGKTLATASTTREYDSDKGTSRFSQVTRMAGMTAGAGELDQIVVALIDECVAEFLSKISPHEVVVSEELQRGKSEIVGTGTKLAAAGDYKEALECYKKGMAEAPDDHEAVFDAGVMYEALGDLKKAEELYNKAFTMKPVERYVLARQRVRTEQPK